MHLHVPSPMYSTPFAHQHPSSSATQALPITLFSDRPALSSTFIVTKLAQKHYRSSTVVGGSCCEPKNQSHPRDVPCNTLGLGMKSSESADGGPRGNGKKEPSVERIPKETTSAPAIRFFKGDDTLLNQSIEAQQGHPDGRKLSY
jgi:hypothetical protein